MTYDGDLATKRARQLIEFAAEDEDGGRLVKTINGLVAFQFPTENAEELVGLFISLATIARIALDILVAGSDGQLTIHDILDGLDDPSALVPPNTDN